MLLHLLRDMQLACDRYRALLCGRYRALLQNETRRNKSCISTYMDIWFIQKGDIWLFSRKDAPQNKTCISRVKETYIAERNNPQNCPVSPYI